MKAWIIPAGISTGADALTLVERPSPWMGDNQIRIRVRACSTNYRDAAVALGRYLPGPVMRDTIPLSDGAGEVIEVGAAVTRWKVGDRVVGCFFQNWFGGTFSASVSGSDLGGPIDGMLAEEVVLSEQGVVGVPDSLSFEEAACLPCAAVTAWNALFEVARVKPGQSVLTMGTGGVSIFALQFAKLAGARVISTSSSDEKLARAKALGADETINYRSVEDWEQKVLQLTDGTGVDAVVEVGGPGTLPRSIASAACGGTVALIGVLTGAKGGIEAVPMVRRAVRMEGTYVGSKPMFEAMNRAIEVNELRPVIDTTFTFADAPQAYRYQASGAHFGKVVIAIN